VSASEPARARIELGLYIASQQKSEIWRLTATASRSDKL